MIRFLVIIAILALIYYIGLWLIKRKLNHFLGQFTPPKAPQPPEIEKLVACQICKTYVPLSKATERAGHYYCQEHAASS
jgi:hypothetical protein